MLLYECVFMNMCDFVLVGERGFCWNVKVVWRGDGGGCR